MGVMYLFDSLQTVRAAIVDGVTQCVHHESARTLDAAIPSKYQAEPGEYLGFLCVDGLWRLFCITEAEDDDAEGVCYIKATDAAVDDLEHKVVQDKYQKGVKAQAAAEALLEGTGWQLATVTTDNTTNTTDAKWVSLWQALLTLAEVYGAQVEPYYIIQDGEITGKRIDLMKDEPVFRGRLYESRINADDVRQIKRKRPVTVLYGLGKAQGTGDEAENLTFADVAWSKTNGDPADKPAGQTWVEDVEASARYGRRELTFTAGDIEDQGELLKATWEELQKQKKPEITVELTIHDAEQLHGGEWKTVRRGDLVIVRTRAGRDTETRVVDIERDYVRPELTKFTSGKELPKATNQTAGLIRASIKTQETLTLYRNRFEHDEALIQLYANTILLHADELLSLRAGIDDNLAQIILRDGKITQIAGDVEDLHTTVTVEADGIREIIQKNDKTLAELKSTIDGLEHWVTNSEGNISELTNTVRGLESKVETADGRVSKLTNTADGLTNTIIGQGNDFALFYTRVDEIGNTVKDTNGNVGSLITKSDSASAKIANVDGRVSQLAVTADGLNYTLTKQGQELSALRALIDEISLTVRDTNGAMGQFVVKSDSITGKLEDANGKLTALQELTEDRFRVVLGDIETIEGDIDTITGSAIWQDRNKIVSAVGEIDTLEGNIGAITGSTLWQTRNAITGVVGNMTFDEKGNVYIKEGGGLRIYKSGVAYGVYDENNLTAGLMVQKLNDGSTSAKIKADVINLEGYVKATTLETNYAKISDLSSVQANITNLTSGLTVASVLSANMVNGTQGRFTYLHGDAINLGDNNLVCYTMEFAGRSGKYFGTGGGLNLAHSHAVTVNDDGTITLGEVSAEGGNFKIADTKAYKDGVSAAYGNGYNVGYGDGKDAYLPTAINRTGYSTADKTVTVRALNSHQDLLTGQVIDAVEIYNAGWNECRAAMTRINNLYTISQNAPGTLYMLVNGNYTSVGTDWVKVTSYSSAYRRPAEIA